MTTQPTPEFRRRHDVEAPRVDGTHFRQAWLVRTRLDQLRAAGRITPGEWQAAAEYRAAWAIARELAAPAEPGTLRGRGGSASHDGAMIARLEAVERLRLVEAAIGSDRCRLLLACLVHDLAWAAIARHIRRDPHTARNWTVSALQALGAVWGHGGLPPDLWTPRSALLARVKRVKENRHPADKFGSSRVAAPQQARVVPDSPLARAES